MNHKKTILQNGLTIIEVPIIDAKSVIVDFFVKTGSRSESPKENGISHFLEHFLFKGSKKYPNAMAISSLIDSIGGEMNANTGKEHTQYYIKSAAKHLPLIFGVLTDMMQNPVFDKTELEKEKGVIIEEINMYKDTPMYEIENVLEQTMWPGIALGRDIAGTKETVSKFTREMFLNYINKHYQTSNIILGVAGKYDRKKLFELITKFWAKYPKKKHYGWEKAKDGQKAPRVKIEYKETQQAHLSLGFKGFEYGNKKNPVVSVLGTILGGGMSSRLFSEVREKRGLAYYVRASSGSYQDTGAFNIGAGVQVNKVEEAIKIILAELKKIKGNSIGAEELTKAKEYLKGKTILALEDNQNRLDWFLERQAFFSKVEKPSEAFKRVDAVKSSDVVNVAKELFKKEKMTLAIIGPYKSEAKFKKLLNV